jgi:outer membrane protein TolC
MHQTLYHHHTAPRTHTMRTALSNAHAALSEAQRRLDEEEAELDRQLGEYEEVLRLVDGGYAQVVEDMAKVRQGTEECRHDLRRLGWSGD